MKVQKSGRGGPAACIQHYALNALQVMSLLKAAGGEQEGASWDQGELAETLWAEMGLQPDAQLTQVCTNALVTMLLSSLRPCVLHCHYYCSSFLDPLSLLLQVRHITKATCLGNTWKDMQMPYGPPYLYLYVCDDICCFCSLDKTMYIDGTEWLV